jgi:putative ABC transport system permease protein
MPIGKRANMHINFLKTAWRGVCKNKISSVINVTGLSVGMAVAMLIGFWVWDELTFNFVHQNHNRIAQVMEIETINGERNTNDLIAIPLAEELRRNYANDFKRVAVVFPNFTHTVAIGDKKLSQSGEWVQPDLPEMLSLKMRAGNRNALSGPSAVLLSQSLAKALFGTADPMNKTLRLDNMTEVKVGGVYEDIPPNSTFHETKLFLSWDKALTVMTWLKDAQTQWDNRVQRIYVQLNDHVDMNLANDKIRNIIGQHVKNREEELLLFPMNKWHLYGEFKNGRISGGGIRYVWMFGLIGIFVLLLACINFMNLSTARSEKRAKEVGIRKAIGSSRSGLIWQFLGESLLVSFVALIVALAIVALSVPFFNLLTDKQLSVPISDPLFLLLILIFAVLTGIIAGSYPAFHLSAFDPVKALKGTFRTGRFESLPRKVLVVVQFTVSIALITGTIIVYRQIQFAKNRPVGYSRRGLLMVTMNTPEIYSAPYNALRNELIQTGAVTDMAKSSTPSTEAPENNTGVNWKGKNPDFIPVWGEVTVTHDFGNTIGWHITKGRDFSRALSTDSGSLILNEAAVKITGLKNPIGKSISWDGQHHTVIGVVKDMVMESPYQPVKPTAFCLGYAGDFYNALTIRINPNSPTHEAIEKIEKVFKKYNPGGSFEYKFIDEEYARKFSDEERTGNLATCFALLAIFISCLGLFGLTSFVAERRTREIGIRKLLGASVLSVWKLLTGEFVVLVFISFLLSTPVSYYFMHNWLENYSYRAGMPWWIFAATVTGALIITLVTVSFQAIKAALVNPVKSLRSE